MNPGDVVGDQFEVEALAGRGGMGLVYRARDRQTGELVALKILYGQELDVGERFSREARAMAQLSHPGVVRYVGHGKTPSGSLFLAMEWLEGESLAERLRATGLTLQESLTMARGVAEALGAAHRRGIVHRDLKPSNLLLVDGSVERVKLLDFGIARLSDGGARVTQTGAMIGTPGYMAPEQARGERDIDARADVFSLGCVLFRCLTGEPAFRGEDVLAVMLKVVLETAPRVRTLRDDVPETIDDLVARMMSKSPSERPADGAALAEELAALGDLDAGTESRRAPHVPSLTASEQRVVCLVLARLPGTAAPPPPTDDKDTSEIPQDAAMRATDTHAFGERDRQKLALRMVVDRYGGRFDVLADGSHLVTISGVGPPTDHASQAARCALAMRTIVGEVPMAVIAGRALVGARSPMGEVIDRGAGLLGKSHGEVRLDEITAGLIGTRFDVGGDRDGLILRGEREAGDGARTLLGRATPCVGRDREIVALQGFFEECVEEPRSRVVLVTAPAGVGKSRLRYEFLRLLHDSGPVEVWIARGDLMSAGSPFGMITEPIRRAAGILDGEPGWVRLKKLSARVSRNVAPEHRARVTEFLGELLGVSQSGDESAQLKAARRDPVLMGDQMRRAFEDLLQAECVEHPVVLVLEDLHWGDLPSVKFIDSALRNLPQSPLLVLALARPEVHDLFPGLWGERNLQEIRLGELTKRGAERLIRGVLPDVGDDTVKLLVDRAAGNAFYLEELIRAVAEGKTTGLPATVLAMVEARLDALEAEARRILRAGAVFGQVFWRGGLAALLGTSHEGKDLDDWLEVLKQREMISRRVDSKFPGEPEYVFRHALLQEAAYAMLTESDRTLGHRLAAEWLESVGEHDPVLLAEHYQRGGDQARAVGWFRRAASQALEGNDLEAAVSHARRGMDGGVAEGEVLGALQLSLAEAHRWRGEFAETERWGLAARSNLPRGSDAWHQATSEAALAAGRLGHPERIMDLFAELRDVADVSEASEPHAVASAQAAGVLLFSGRSDLAEELFNHIDAFVAARDVTDPAVLGTISRARAMRALYAGDPSSFLAHMEEASRRFEEAGDLRGTATQRVNVGYAYMELGGYAEAEGVLTDVLSMAERLGLFMVAVSARHNLGLALARQGRVAQGRELELQAIESAVAQGDRRIECAARTYLGSILAQAGELDAAEAEVLSAIDAAAASPPAKAYALATLAKVRLERGDLAGSASPAREAMAVLDETGALEEGESLVRLVHAEVLLAEGDRDRAREALALAKERLGARADRIKDAKWRDSFLSNVPENRRTLELADAELPGGASVGATPT